MCIKDPWTKPKGGRIEGGVRESGGGKRRQLYLNNNKKIKGKKRKREVNSSKLSLRQQSQVPASC